LDTAIRNYSLGQEWVYLKIYSGPKVLEKILTEEIYSLATACYDDTIIDRFFFIRYYDEDYHLRLRFRIIDPKQDTATIIQKINAALAPYIESKIIWKVAYDTYNRELERYGNNTIDEAETLFSFESMMVIEALHLIPLNEDGFGADTTWLYTIRIINFLLDAFSLDTVSKMKILQSYSDGMIQEFKVEKDGRQVLNDLYRDKRKELEMMFDKGLDLKIDSVIKRYANVEAIQSAIAKIHRLRVANELEMDFVALMHSLMHMTNNRMFRTNQRQNELYVYYLMSKCLTSIDAKERKNGNS